VFKSWQVFVFSLVPLALVFAGVVIGSMPGLDSDRQEIPAVPPHSENPASPGPTAVPGATQLELAAENLQYDKTSLSAPAGQPVSLVFDNRDAGVLHNVAFYADPGHTQKIFVGELTTGPVTTTYNFDAPSTPGGYFFRCDVHTDMTGQFTVN
jgi:plastocyanin